jgi:type IV pilus assembly protein PilB
VASSTRALMAQRLVRKVCKKCAHPYTPTDVELRTLNIDPSQAQKATFLKGRGCADCSNTGYRGRMGIFEMFVIDDDARKLIYEKVPASVLRGRAREMGMSSGPRLVTKREMALPRDRLKHCNGRLFPPFPPAELFETRFSV